MMKCEMNKYNFNIIVSSIGNGENVISDIFNTIVCDDDLTANFRIMILYSIFISDEESSDGVPIKLLLKYYNDLEDNEKNLYLNLHGQTIGESKESKEKSSNRRTYSSEIKLPIKGYDIEAGRITIDSDIKFPGYGKYQLELYYKTNSDEKDTIATVYPITVKKMK